MNSKKTIRSRPLIELRNIGKKIAGRLSEIDVYTEDDLKQMGAAAHKRIKKIIRTKRWPFATIFILLKVQSRTRTGMMFRRKENRR